MIRAAVLMLIPLLCAVAAEKKQEEPFHSWGLVSALRSASVPYATAHPESRLNSYVLLLYLDSPLFFLNGTEGGIKLYRDASWQLAAYGALHFVDMPRHDPGYFTDDTADVGVMASYDGRGVRTDLLLLSDPAWRLHAKLRVGTERSDGALRWRPYAAVGYNSADFNRYYYGADRVRVGGDAVAEAGVDSRLFLTNDIALIGNAKLAYLGRESAAAATTDAPLQSEIYVGAGVFQSRSRPQKTFNPKGYVRIAFGEATPSSFSENIMGQGVRDRHGLYLLSVFYGLPLSKTLFGADIHTYFTPGFAHHFGNRLQPSAQEYVAAVKFFYRPPSWWLRFGVGTGLSYITRTTYIERYINEKDGYDHTSHLLQNVDISLDVPLSHLLGGGWRHVWFGYALHHRSGVFESAHQYGQIKGGSNYNTLYVQVHFEQ
jgi:MipA family protein